MNENIDLTKILKNCPKGTKFYSYTFGEETYFQGISLYEGNPLPIHFCGEFGECQSFYLSRKGHPVADRFGECVIFPSKDQRDWSKFTAPWYKKEKFDPNTLNMFDRVLGRDCDNHIWKCDLFSHITGQDYFPYKCVGKSYKYCIPCNDDTKHLVGIKDEAPEYYRYWEDEL